MSALTKKGAYSDGNNYSELVDFNEFEQYLKTIKTGKVKTRLNPKHIKRIIGYNIQFLKESNCNHETISVHYIENFLERRNKTR